MTKEEKTQKITEGIKEEEIKIKKNIKMEKGEERGEISKEKREAAEMEDKEVLVII